MPGRVNLRTVVRALLRVLPTLVERLSWAELGRFPTPLEPLPELCAALGQSTTAAFVKRDDLSSEVYGGNKVRTLELLFGAALRDGVREIHSTGAFGSNHALATALHAPRVGLTPGAVLFPQPPSWAALENLTTLLSSVAFVRALPHWSMLPAGVWHAAREARTARRHAVFMVPGGATPLGALGYVSAALELAEQLTAAQSEPPRSIVVGVGSTCTSAGLLVGLALASRLGIGWSVPQDRPHLISVRVTPWPVTSRWNVLRLATATSSLLAALTGDAALRFSAADLGERFHVEGGYLGDGYGRPTEAGAAAMELWRQHVGFSLDTTYSAKSAAAVLDLVRARRGPVVFWSTKSSRPLPAISNDAIAAAPITMRDWIRASERALADRGELPLDYRSRLSVRDPSARERANIVQRSTS
jgi:D-cysteine desulfhydrase